MINWFREKRSILWNRDKEERKIAMSQSVIEETQAPPVGAEETHKGPTCYKKEIGPENFIFIVLFVAFFALFAAKVYGREQPMIDGGTLSLGGKRVRPVRAGGTGTRFMSALLDGGMDGVKMGVSIIPGVLVICTVVMMLTNGPAESGLYTGAAYEGIGLLPKLADKLSFILTPLFGFSSPEGLAVPVTALGAAGAAISLVPQLLAEGKAAGGDIAVFTAMCMCWSGYLSTHVSMMNSLGCNHLIGKAIISHTVGGLCAGVAAHWLYVLFALL